MTCTTLDLWIHSQSNMTLPSMPVFSNRCLFRNIPTSNLSNCLWRVFIHSMTMVFSSGIQSNPLSFRVVCTVQRGRYKQCAIIVRRRGMSMTSPQRPRIGLRRPPSAPQKRSSISVHLRGLKSTLLIVTGWLASIGSHRLSLPWTCMGKWS